MNGKEKTKDILMPILNHWTNQIFSGLKPFEFRNHIGLRWSPGSKIYIYESKRNGGAGLVAGEAVMEKIIRLPETGFGPPRPLLRYWAEHIKKDDGLVQLLDELGEYELPNYKKGTVLRYLGRPDLLTKAMESGKWVFMADGGEDPAARCEDWLTAIGLIDEFGVYCYHYAIQLGSIKKYDTPKSLAEYGLQRAPQSWCYIKKEED